MGWGGGSIAGGVVLIFHLAVIGLCARARGTARSRADRQAWTAIAVVLAALAAEKAFHLETLLINRFGRIAQEGGWYGARRGVQVEAIAALALTGVLLAGATIWLLRRANGSARVAGVATVLLGAFVSVRAVSLHQLDRLLGSGVGPLRISNVVELAALCAIGGAAWTAGRTAPGRIGGG